MSRFLIYAVLGTVVATALTVIALTTRPRPEITAYWTEPDDGFAPGELPQTDPRATYLCTYLRGWQSGQVTYTCVGREWEQ